MLPDLDPRLDAILDGPGFDFLVGVLAASACSEIPPADAYARLRANRGWVIGKVRALLAEADPETSEGSLDTIAAAVAIRIEARVAAAAAAGADAGGPAN